MSTSEISVKLPCFRQSILNAALSVYNSVREYIESDSDEFEEDRMIKCMCKEKHFDELTITCAPRFINPGYGSNFVKIFNSETKEFIITIDEEELLLIE